MAETPFPGIDVRLEGHSPELTLRYCTIGQYDEAFSLGWLVSTVIMDLSITTPFQDLNTPVMEELPKYVRESFQGPVIAVDRS